jgi:hypothetical protein
MLRVLYRGRLSSCNYGCQYCPFAKKQDSRAELEADYRDLERFLAWALARQRPLGVLFTPWGEALIRRPYQEALVRLTNAPHVQRAAIQTNLSGDLGFVRRCDLSRLALWATWHPEWCAMDDFLARVEALDAQGARLSVGVVGFAKFHNEIKTLRDRLPPHIYLWINAVKDELPQLPPDTRALFSEIDPLYEYNTRRYASLGQACGAGEDVISVDGDGTARRCHFIPTPLGSIYDEGFDQRLQRRPCTNAQCHCHIGYVHMDALGLREVFGAGILERIPAGDWRDRSRRAPPAL